MAAEETIYILGSGAIGFPLAAHLTRAGRRAIAVRTSRKDVPPGTRRRLRYAHQRAR